MIADITSLYKEETGSGRAYKNKHNKYSIVRIPTIKYVEWLEKKLLKLLLDGKIKG